MPMPLATNTNTSEPVVPQIALEESTPAAANSIEISLYHELGSAFHGGTVEAARYLPPSMRPVVVMVQSHIVAHGLQGIQSAGYMATVRRRKCRKLADAIKGLEQQPRRDDFVVCTHPVLIKIKELLATLTNAAAEGNTREILRQLRNTLMDGGWNSYRNPQTRQTAIDIFDYLAEAEEVLPAKVDETFDRLLDQGLAPVGAPVFEVDEEDEAPYAQDQISG